MCVFVLPEMPLLLVHMNCTYNSLIGNYCVYGRKAGVVFSSASVFMIADGLKMNKPTRQSLNLSSS